MDEDEQDVYVAQLQEVFDSCDRTGKGALNRAELIELCKKLQLDDQVPQLLQQLLGSEEADGQVTFEDFKEGFVAVLSQAIDALSSSEDEAETTTEPVEPPKYVKGEKRYGRKSKPDTSYSEDLYSADDESLAESRPASARSSRTLANGVHEDHTDMETSRGERPGKIRRKLSSRKSSLRNSIRRHNSMKWQRHSVSRNDSTISQDDVDMVESSGQINASRDSVNAINNSGYESPSEEEQLKAIWTEVNVGANGFLNYHELALVCDHIGMDSMNEQELTLLFEELDEDGDGKVSFNEFLHGLFAAKDHYQDTIEEEFVEMTHSTPAYSQPPSGNTSRSKNTSRDDLFLTRTGGTNSSFGFDLFSSLDPDNTGLAKREDIKELWEAQDLHDAIAVLEHVDTDAEGKVNLHQLTDLLETVIHEQNDGLSRAVVGIYKHEAASMRSHMEQLGNERDALRDNIVKLTEEKEMLIAESEDATRQLERIHEGRIKDTESSFLEKMQTLQQTMQEEREKDLLNSTHHRSMLEDSLKNTKSEEARLKQKLVEAEEEILRLEKNLSEAQDRLSASEMTRDRLEKELDSMSDLSVRLADLEKQQLLKQQQNRNANKSVRELERINRELRDENDELRLQVEGLTAQVNSSVKRRPSHRKRQGSEKVHRVGSVLSDYTKPKVIRRNKEGVTSSEESEEDEVDGAGTQVHVRLSGDGGSNEDGENDVERENHRKEIERLEGKVQELSDAISEHEGSIKERDITINNLKNEVENLRSSMENKEEDLRQRYDGELANLTSQFTGEMEQLQKNFVKEREEMEKDYQSQINELEESLKSEKEVLSKDLEGSFSQMKEMLISEYESEKAELENEHQGEKTMLETFFHSQLEEAKANFNEEKDKLREKIHVLEEEKEELELKFLNEKSAMEQQFRIEKSEWELSSSSSKAEFQKNQRDWSNLKTELEKSHREKIHELESSYRKEKSTREEEFDNQMWELKQGHSKEVASLKQNFEQQKTELEQMLSREKSEMREARTREQNEMQQKFKRELSELRETLEKDHVHNLAVQEAELRKEFLQDRSESEKSLKEEKYKLEEEFQANVASNEKNFQKWKSEIEEHFMEEKAKLLQNAAREKAELEQKYLDEITELRQAFHEGEAGLQGQLKDDFLLLLSQHKAELEESYAREKAQLEESYFREKEDFQRSGLVQASEVKESYNREKQELEESYKQKIKELQKNFAKEKQEIEDEYAHEKENIRAELENEFSEKIKSENEALEETVKHLQGEINYLKEQKKELETKVQSLELKSLSSNSLDFRVAKEKISDLEQKVNQLEREKSRLLEENAEFKVRMDELESEKSELSDSVLNKQRQLLKAEETKSSIVSLERKLEEVCNKKNVVEKLLREKNASCTDLQEEVYRLKEKLANMENAHQREMETEKQRVMVATTELATLKSRNQRENAELRDQLHRANISSERDQALREKVFNEAKAEVMSLNKKLEEKSRRLRELESAGGLWEGRIRELEKQKQELTHQLMKTREALDEHVARLSKELQQKDTKCLRSDTLVTELYIENAKLMKALAQTEASEKKAEKSNRQLMEQKRALQRVISKLCGANAIA
ncbi:ninein-like protein isoform X5 [Nematostella vectensis]|uniref:ninein-like protein isoform X5 n=1 Tax=Nematostella vectensis TaxID=45351 RepID=UPI002076F47C|nr:ninein-like protein isoform X5 [Nematostella vectensis]